MLRHKGQLSLSALCIVAISQKVSIVSGSRSGSVFGSGSAIAAASVTTTLNEWVNFCILVCHQWHKHKVAGMPLRWPSIYIPNSRSENPFLSSVILKSDVLDTLFKV